MDDRIRCASKWVAAVGFVAALMAAPTAYAHIDAISASCEAGLNIDLVAYDPAGANSVTATIDGATVISTNFGSSYASTLPFGDPFATHTYRVVVNAWDDPTGAIGYSFDTGTRSIPVCAVVTTTSAAPTTTLGPTPPTVSSTPASVAPASTSTVPTSSVPPSSVVIPSVSPGSVVIVAQAPPTTVLVASLAAPPAGELPATGANMVVFVLGLVVGGTGVVATLLARRRAS